MRELERAVERVRENMEQTVSIISAAIGEPLPPETNMAVSLADLRLLLSALEWRPIAEYDRERDGDVIISTAIGQVGEAYLTARDGWYWANIDPADYHGRPIDHPTHFRPLPPTSQG